MPALNTVTSSARTGLTLVRCFADREAKTLYKRSILGWLWSLINPLMTVGVYSMVFGVIYRASPPVTANGKAEAFALYLFSGLVVWNVFTAVINGAMRWLRDVSDLRKKIYFPTEAAIIGGVSATMIQSGLEALVLVVIMAMLGNIAPTLLFLPVALVITAAFGTGLGFFVAVLNVRYRDIQHLVTIGLSVAFFTVPIVFTPDIVPDQAYGLPVRRIMEANPLNSMIAMARDAVYFLRVPDLREAAVALAWAVGAFVLGIWYFRRRSMAISEEP